MKKEEPRLKLQLKKLPNSPGVYFFKKSCHILYIGKAASLKNRVRSYFTDKTLKTRELINQATKIEFIKTDNVLEALFLEANLIKKHWPKYNILGKDNKSFVYLAIAKPKVKDFPFPFIIRGQYLKKYPSKNFEIFGPFKNAQIVKEALKILRKIFPYCQYPNLSRPCFHYQIGLCPGACIGAIEKKDYQKIIKNLIKFLKGNKKSVIIFFQKNDPEKVEILKRIQDGNLISREKIGEDFNQKLIRIEGYDISHFSGKYTYASMVVFENFKPLKSDYRLFKIRTGRSADDIAAIKEALSRRLKHSEWPFPDIFLIDGGLGQTNALNKILNKHHIHIPVVGIAKGKNNKDRFIFKGVDKNFQELIKSSKITFQQVRNEAHRFAKKFSTKSINRLK